ncbi:GGDEF domain-containing protein [Pseudanabaena sp. FACHB-2040]|uniref:GGDEF domain-containing protein n=1 Tax=Pseudanabaena sp. FACHB-2040 TaxID=2692859 RepID=UPI0016824E2F|nr:GGDEF domain-containing protein [Pseudanabaena sp. FACHB-2040]MBD2258483.1 GGDEF domain-containing protein [Pseudanabaena sp. FACHB-2040]
MSVLPMLVSTMPHGSCFLWNPWLTSLHALADGGIAVAYFSIPVLLYIYREHAATAARPLLLLFAAFILSCGVGHVLSAWNIWHANYWIEGSWKWVTLSISSYTVWQLRSTIPQLLATHKDLEITRELLERDPLTGVANRRGLESAYERVKVYYGSQPLNHALMLLDLDGFKQVNDTYGHHVGDMLLQKVAAALCDRTRSLDTVARLGGDEFAVLLAGCSGAGAKLIADEIRQVIATLQLPELPADFQVTVSIGISEFRADADLEPSYVQADGALYQAKGNGKNQVSLALTP